MTDDAIAFYADHAARLRAAWQRLDPAALLAPVRAHLPTPPARILDVGAGTGQIARHLSRLGHDVVAAEPVAAFHGTAGPAWVNARLPELDGINGVFDAILLLGVWQHVAPPDRPAALARLARAMAAQGRVIMALRHGEVPDDRPIWSNPVEETLLLADASGMICTDRIEAPSVQPVNRAAGVTWTWLVLHGRR